jgi:hypothetical protein
MPKYVSSAAHTRQTRSGARLVSSNTRVFFPSVAKALAAHPALLENRVKSDLQIFPVLYANESLVELTVRFPANYSPEIMKQRLGEIFTTVKEGGGINSGPIVLSMTLNCVLEGKGQGGLPSYSVFFGQDFGSDGSPDVLKSSPHSGDKHAVCESQLIRRAADIGKKINFSFSPGELERNFERCLLHQSDVRVARIINQVFIFRGVNAQKFTWPRKLSNL